MGHPTNSKPRPQGTSRRGFFRRSGSAAVALASVAALPLAPTGLRAATTYFYRFLAENETSPVGRTRTLPVGATPRLRLAVMSCSNHAAGYFNAYRHVAERRDLDLVVHLGDYLYEYGPDEYGSLRTPEPANEMVTLSDYRRRHAQYRRDADLQAVHRQHPMVCIWDDHEITNDAWRDGAQNHTEGTEGRWAPTPSASGCRPTTSGCPFASPTRPSRGATNAPSRSATWSIW